MRFKDYPYPLEARTILVTSNTSGIIENDRDISAQVLAEHNVALFALSYFHYDENACTLRITCKLV